MATAPHVQLGSSAIEVVAGNAFRILGLPARASEGDVRIAASAMRSGLKLGITKSTVWDSPWLGPLSRTEETVEDAVARLRDPARRLRERFFWFHDGDELMPSLALASLENTASRWSLAPGLSARHDAALLMLLAAVLSDPEVQNESQWLRALREWKQVIEADDY
ncbi:MAG TPA: hypothetical protein VER55_00510, partial [Ardenticatenaceae bacterium]|nr:hypothetical protein [Ardenticatenaceae bacterium]